MKTTTYWDRVDKAVAAMGWPSFNGMKEGDWQEKLATKLEETKAKIDRLEEIANDAENTLILISRITAGADLTIDMNSEVFKYLSDYFIKRRKTASPKEPG